VSGASAHRYAYAIVSQWRARAGLLQISLRGKRGQRERPGFSRLRALAILHGERRIADLPWQQQRVTDSAQTNKQTNKHD
jgi:hypothetical protein